MLFLLEKVLGKWHFDAHIFRLFAAGPFTAERVYGTHSPHGSLYLKPGRIFEYSRSPLSKQPILQPSQQQKGIFSFKNLAFCWISM